MGLPAGPFEVFQCVACNSSNSRSEENAHRNRTNRRYDYAALREHVGLVHCGLARYKCSFCKVKFATPQYALGHASAEGSICKRLHYLKVRDDDASLTQPIVEKIKFESLNLARLRRWDVIISECVKQLMLHSLHEALYPDHHEGQDLPILDSLQDLVVRNDVDIPVTSNPLECSAAFVPPWWNFDFAPPLILNRTYSNDKCAAETQADLFTSCYRCCDPIARTAILRGGGGVIFREAETQTGSKTSSVRGDVLRAATYIFPDFYKPEPVPKYWEESQTEEAILEDERAIHEFLTKHRASISGDDDMDIHTVTSTTTPQSESGKSVDVEARTIHTGTSLSVCDDTKHASTECAHQSDFGQNFANMQLLSDRDVRPPRPPPLPLFPGLVLNPTSVLPKPSFWYPYLAADVRIPPPPPPPPSQPRPPSGPPPQSRVRWRFNPSYVNRGPTCPSRPHPPQLPAAKLVKLEDSRNLTWVWFRVQTQSNEEVKRVAEGINDETSQKADEEGRHRPPPIRYPFRGWRKYPPPRLQQRNVGWQVWKRQPRNAQRNEIRRDTVGKTEDVNANDDMWKEDESNNNNNTPYKSLTPEHPIKTELDSNYGHLEWTINDDWDADEDATKCKFLSECGNLYLMVAVGVEL